MVPVPTFDFSPLGFIFFGAGTAFFIRLRPAFFVSHNLLSFRWLLLVASPPHHSMRRQTFLISNRVGTGKRRVSRNSRICLLARRRYLAICVLEVDRSPGRLAALIASFELTRQLLRPSAAILRFHPLPFDDGIRTQQGRVVRPVVIGYPAWIRTMNNASKGRCVTVTPRGIRISIFDCRFWISALAAHILRSQIANRNSQFNRPSPGRATARLQWRRWRGQTDVDRCALALHAADRNLSLVRGHNGLSDRHSETGAV